VPSSLEELDKIAAGEKVLVEDNEVHPDPLSPARTTAAQPQRVPGLLADHGGQDARVREAYPVDVDTVGVAAAAAADVAEDTAGIPAVRNPSALAVGEGLFLDDPSQVCQQYSDDFYWRTPLVSVVGELLHRERSQNVRVLTEALTGSQMTT